MKKLFSAKQTMLGVAVFIALITIPTTVRAQNPGSWDWYTCTALRADAAALQASIIGFGYYAAVAAVTAPELFLILATLAAITSLMIQYGC